MEYDDSGRKSRSRKKRESTALQDMGEMLARLPGAVVSRLPVSESLRDAVLHWQGLSAHEARRRQMQYIGKLMREVEDADAFAAMLHEAQGNVQVDEKRLQQVEALRASLLQTEQGKGEEALKELCATYPDTDAAWVKKLVLACQQQPDGRGKPFRELFRYLRTLARKEPEDTDSQQ